MLETKHQFSRSLQFQSHSTWAKHLICWTNIKLHICDIKLTLIVMLHLTNFGLPIFPHLLALAICTIFFHRHHIWRCYIQITYTSTQHITPHHSIILHRSRHIIWVFQIQTTLRRRQRFIIIHPYALYTQRSHLHTIIVLPRCHTIMHLSRRQYRHHTQ